MSDYGIGFKNVIEFLSGYFGIESFWDIFRTVLDIGIVAFFFYWLIMILRDSRAWQIVKGIIIVILISIISNFAGFKTISYIIGLILQVLPVLLVVIFQPEIRRALEGVGKGRFRNLFFTRNAGRSSDAVVKEVVSAALSMSKNRVGALIVFERDTNLGEIIRTGTVVNAEVSSQLLQLIFVPNTPLHDGAVIIRSEKIYSAACFLPLSGDRTLSKELGTRHRAGLGVTENTDCVSVIVSEETGQISVAVNGRLKRGLSADELREFLDDNVAADPNSSKYRFRFGNGGSK